MSRPCCRNNGRLALALLAVALVAASPAPFSLDKGKREPIVVTSRTMEADKLGDIVTFNGDVVLKKEAMTLNADTLVVYYDGASKGSGRSRRWATWWYGRKGGSPSRTRLSITAAMSGFRADRRSPGHRDENQVAASASRCSLRDERSIIEGGKVLFYQDRWKAASTRHPCARASEAGSGRGP